MKKKEVVFKDYFLIFGYDGLELNYFHVGDDSYYTGWTKDISSATIFTEDLFEKMRDTILEESGPGKMVLVSKMPIKIGG